MNKQRKNEKSRGIEWTDYTWNPVKGCHHACRWTMPDGTVAVCYAETIATKVAQSAYPHGFEHHYWNPKLLDEPLKLKDPAKIFLDSMSDLMGQWVPSEQIEAVLAVCRRAHWHHFQLLTKNAPRLEQFNFPPNVWVGVSAPPTSMLGHDLTLDQQKRLVDRQLRALRAIRGAGVRWMSVEPLSFDIAPLLVDAPLDWVVIGAATNGMRTYQPERAWVENLLAVLDEQNIPVFFKGNLKWDAWREDFPTPRAIYRGQGVICGEFHMQTWVHESGMAQLEKIESMQTGSARYGILQLPRTDKKPVYLTKRKACELLTNGEWRVWEVKREIIT